LGRAHPWPGGIRTRWTTNEVSWSHRSPPIPFDQQGLVALIFLSAGVHRVADALVIADDLQILGIGAGELQSDSTQVSIILQVGADLEVMKLDTGIDLQLGGVQVRGGTGVEAGAILNLGGDLEVYSSILAGNQGEFGSGAIENLAGDVTLSDVLIDGNLSLSGGSGAVGGSGGSIDIIDSTITNNQGADAGAVFTFDGDLVIDGTLIQGNTGGSDAGCVVALGTNVQILDTAPSWCWRSCRCSPHAAALRVLRIVFARDRIRHARVFSSRVEDDEMRRRLRGDPSGACAVCGSREIEADEVTERGVLRLSECRRCLHRWTESVAPAREAGPLAAGPRVAEVVAAA
ncbi:MAG: hypothetical protein QNK03_28295, partial [Myxococcota bacterium]|nr:hypothetical protein [Myxococcota bacterium]